MCAGPWNRPSRTSSLRSPHSPSSPSLLSMRSAAGKGGGWAWGAAPSNSGFCWDSLPASQAPQQQAAQPVQQQQQDPGARQGGYGLGAAQLSARLAQSSRDAKASAFEFCEPDQPAAFAPAPPVPKPAAGASVGLRGRSGAAATAAAPAPARAGWQPPQPPPSSPQQHKRHARTAGHAQPVNDGNDTAAAAPLVAATTAAPARPALQPRGSKAPAPQVSASMPLERYLEFRQHLTKGAASVRQLSELERSVLKAGDLKQILLVNGMAAGNKSKKEVLDGLLGMRLQDPTCCLLETPGPQGPASQSAGPVLEEPHVLQTLNWLSLPGEQLQHLCSQGMQQGPRQQVGAHAYSCCPLPTVVIRGLPASEPSVAAAVQQQQQEEEEEEGQQQDKGQQGAGTQGGSTAPAESEVTVASGRAAAFAAIPDSEEVGQQQVPQLGKGQPPRNCATEALAGREAEEGGGVGPGSGTVGSLSADREAREWEGGELQAEEELGSEEPCQQAPEWLAAGVQRITERSQGSTEQLRARELLGRKVVFVMLEDFEQEDERGITDTVCAGVHEGLVLEQALEGSQGAALPSAPSSRWFFVRVKASSTTSASTGTGTTSGSMGSGAGGSRGSGGGAGQHPPGRRQYQPRRLDFQLDLQQDFQAAALEDLLGMGPEELQDAWVLLEPRSEGEEADVHAPEVPLRSKPTTTQQHPGKAGRGQGRQRPAVGRVTSHTGGKETAAAAATAAVAAGAQRLASKEQQAGGAQEQHGSQHEQQSQLPPPPSHHQQQRQWQWQQQQEQGNRQQHPAADVPWQHKRTRSDAAQPAPSKAPRLAPEPRQGQGRLLAQAAHTKRGVEGVEGALAARVSPQGQTTRPQQQAQQQEQQPQAAPLPLVWANVCGMWWPGQLLEGTLGGGHNLSVCVFGCNVRMTLAAGKVTCFAQDRAARISKLQSDLGRKAVQQALGLEASSSNVP